MQISIHTMYSHLAEIVADIQIWTWHKHKSITSRSLGSTFYCTWLPSNLFLWNKWHLGTMQIMSNVMYLALNMEFPLVSRKNKILKYFCEGSTVFSKYAVYYLWWLQFKMDESMEAKSCSSMWKLHLSCLSWLLNINVIFSLCSLIFFSSSSHCGLDLKYVKQKI